MSSKDFLCTYFYMLYTPLKEDLVFLKLRENFAIQPQTGDYNWWKVQRSKLLRDYHGRESKQTFSGEIRQRVM